MGDMDSDKSTRSAWVLRLSHLINDIAFHMLRIINNAADAKASTTNKPALYPVMTWITNGYRE